MIVSIHNLQIRKRCKLIVRYLGPRSEGSFVFEVFSQVAYVDVKTSKPTGDCVRKTLTDEEKTSNILCQKLNATSFYWNS